MIILDFGSGNTCINDLSYIKKMYDELKKIDSGKKKIVIKWQLFKEAGENLPLTEKSFTYAYNYGRCLDYEITASVFDKESLNFLMKFDVPFVKIANNVKYYPLIDEIPRKYPVYVSWNGEFYNEYIQKNLSNLEVFACVSKYPAKIKDYETMRNLYYYNVMNVSDHTEDFKLYRKFKPNKIEWHYKLEDSTGLDAGSFARTPEQLKEIL